MVPNKKGIKINVFHGEFRVFTQYIEEKNWMQSGKMSNTIVFSDKQSSSDANDLAAIVLSPSDLDQEVNGFYYGKEIIQLISPHLLFENYSFRKELCKFMNVVISNA